MQVWDEATGRQVLQRCLAPRHLPQEISEAKTPAAETSPSWHHPYWTNGRHLRSNRHSPYGLDRMAGDGVTARFRELYLETYEWSEEPCE